MRRRAWTRGGTGRCVGRHGGASRSIRRKKEKTLSRSGYAAVTLARSRGDALAGPTHAAWRRPRRDYTRAAASARAFLGRTRRRLCLFIFLHQSQHVSPQGARGRAAALARTSLLYGRRELPPYRELFDLD